MVYGRHCVVHTPSPCSATFLLMKEAYSCVASVGCTACSQFLYAVFERPSKVPEAPEEIAVTEDPWLVECDSQGAKPRRFAERKA